MPVFGSIWSVIAVSQSCAEFGNGKFVSGGLSPQEKLQLAATCGARYPCAKETQETKTSALAFRESRFSGSLCEQDWGRDCPAGAMHRLIAPAKTFRASASAVLRVVARREGLLCGHPWQ